MEQSPDQIQGLSTAVARELCIKHGPNELPSQKSQNVFTILFNVLREPMLLMLLGSGLLYLLLGEPQDAYMLLAFVFVVIGITFHQERKTERALEALKNLSSPRALVIRDGAQTRIPGREVVIGDIVVLQEGDRVPADAAILSESNLLVDESLLTGESLSVRKTVWDGKTKSLNPGGEDLPFVYSGTLITRGRGIARVVAIGIHTEMGKIGKSLQTIEDEETLLKKETGRIVRDFAIAGAIFCLIVILVYGFTRGNWTEGILAGLTLAMAMLPEEFPVVLLIFLTLGAWRISKRKVLTRKTPAIEMLGATTTLCVDKTGTLTLNKMRLDEIVSDFSHLNLQALGNNALEEKYHALMEYATLASQKDPFDPIEMEIRTKSHNYLTNTAHIHSDWHLIREYPLSRELVALSHVWRSPDEKHLVVASKGAPEAIIDLCHLDHRVGETIMEHVLEMSQRGLRVLGVAKALFDNKELPTDQHSFDFQFVGLIGFTDPIRAGVPESIRECYRAGIRVIMITGDYPGTAQHIARQIGLKNPDVCITGSEIQSMDFISLREKMKIVNVCARVVPEQKLHIVNALKANDEIVAMTGDGVNDAPALKSAHIGVAMGERGTDVARETADLILLNDDFTSIVQAVSMGRRIFDNLKKAMAYIFSVHVPIAGMSLLPILFNLPIVLFPAHIAFLELIIDPACSVVFEAEKEEHTVMNRPPRNLRHPLFDRNTFFSSLVQGMSVLCVVMIVFLLSLRLGYSENHARTLAFVSIVLGNLALIVTNLSKTEHVVQIMRNKNMSLYYVLGGTLIFLFLILNIPFLRNLFHFSTLSIPNIGAVATISLILLTWFEGIKLMTLNRRVSS